MKNIDFEIYNKYWDLLSDRYGTFLDSLDLLEFVNEKKRKMSESTFQALQKDGIELPVGIKAKKGKGGKWLFGIDAVLRWYLGWEINELMGKDKPNG